MAIIDNFRKAANKVPLIIIRGCLTHWTSQFLAADRLIELEEEVTSLGRNHSAPHRDNLVISESRSSKQKAQAMLAITLNPSFWKNLKR